MARINEPLPVPSTAIYSRTDGVVAWRSCIDAEAETAENVEVPGSHIGLLHNPAVLVRDRRPPGPAGRRAPTVPSRRAGCARSPTRARPGDAGGAADGAG